MFFLISKIAPGLLFPYPLFLIVMGYILVRNRKIRHRIACVLFYILILFLSTDGGSALLLRPLEKRFPYRVPALTPGADAIVVLSGMVNPLAPETDRPEFLSPVDRILAGEELLQKGKAPALLISGGSGLLSQKGRPEAEILKQWLIENRGVDPRKVQAESRSRNTAENAIETAHIARKKGWKRVILVTSAFHMPRSVLCFRKVELEVIPFPVDYYTMAVSPGVEGILPTPSALAMSTMALKEYIGIVAYWMRGYI